MESNREHVVAGWRKVAHEWGHAAEAIGIEPFPIVDEADGHEVTTAFAMRLAHVLAKALVDMHIADLKLHAEQAPSDLIAQAVMKMLPGIEDAYNDGKPIPVEEILESLLRAARAA